MPNIMIHERVGLFVSSEFGLSSYDFFLGVLAPDAVNLNGFAPREVRWLSHQRRSDYREWREAIRSFYLQKKGTISDDFLFGYYVHVLTDIVFDEFFYLDIREKILEDGFRLQDAHFLMREDMDKYSFSEISDIIKKLYGSQSSFEILNISSNFLLKWKEKCIQNFSFSCESRYFDDGIILLLCRRVCDEIREELGFI